MSGCLTKQDKKTLLPSSGDLLCSGPEGGFSSALGWEKEEGEKDPQAMVHLRQQEDLGGEAPQSLSPSLQLVKAGDPLHIQRLIGNQKEN